MNKMHFYQPNVCLRGSALRIDRWDVLGLNPSYTRWLSFEVSHGGHSPEGSGPTSRQLALILL